MSLFLNWWVCLKPMIFFSKKREFSWQNWNKIERKKSPWKLYDDATHYVNFYFLISIILPLTSGKVKRRRRMERTFSASCWRQLFSSDHSQLRSNKKKLWRGEIMFFLLFFAFDLKFLLWWKYVNKLGESSNYLRLRNMKGRVRGLRETVPLPTSLLCLERRRFAAHRATL